MKYRQQNPGVQRRTKLLGQEGFPKDPSVNWALEKEPPSEESAGRKLGLGGLGRDAGLEAHLPR